jgi:hypothetical protein
MRLLITWLLGVPAAIIFLFNIFAVDAAAVFTPSSTTLVNSTTSGDKMRFDGRYDRGADVVVPTSRFTE